MKMGSHAGLFVLVLAGLTLGCSRVPGSNDSPIVTEKIPDAPAASKPTPPATRHHFATRASQEPQPAAKSEPVASPTTASSEEDEIDDLIKNLGGKRIDSGKPEKAEPEADALEPGGNAIKKMVERLKGKYETAKDESNNIAISIDLSGTAVTDEDVALLKRAANLVALDLSGTLISDSTVANLRNLTGLLRLNLSATNLTGAALVHLQNLSRLRELDLSFGFGTGGDPDSIVRAIGPKLDADSLKHLERLNNLVDLNLESCSVGDEGMTHLQRLANLEKLNVSNTEISNDGLIHLKELTSLKNLDISGNEDVNNTGLANLKTLTKLESLNAEDTKITPAALARFKRTMKSNPKSSADSAKSDAGATPKSNNSASPAKGSLPQHFDKLALSAEQKEKVTKTAKEYDDKIAAMKKKISDVKGLPGTTSIIIAGAKAVKKLNSERQQALEEILTAEQRSKLRRLRSNN